MVLCNLPVSRRPSGNDRPENASPFPALGRRRSEEHTSELQSHLNLVCRLLLEKKKDPCHHDCEICLGFLRPAQMKGAGAKLRTNRVFEQVIVLHHRASTTRERLLPPAGLAPS